MVNFENGVIPINDTNLNKAQTDLQEQIDNLKIFDGTSEETGYCELPNGLIIQYGIIDLTKSTSDSSTGGYSQTVIFPKAFQRKRYESMVLLLKGRMY